MSELEINTVVGGVECLPYGLQQVDSCSEANNEGTTVFCWAT